MLGLGTALPGLLGRGQGLDLRDGGHRGGGDGGRDADALVEREEVGARLARQPRGLLLDALAPDPVHVILHNGEARAGAVVADESLHGGGDGVDVGALPQGEDALPRGFDPVLAAWHDLEQGDAVGALPGARGAFIMGMTGSGTVDVTWSTTDMTLTSMLPGGDGTGGRSNRSFATSLA